jgi:hypothetical protein
MDCGQTGCHCGPEVRFEEVLRWLDAVITNLLEPRFWPTSE